MFPQDLIGQILEELQIMTRLPKFSAVHKADGVDDDMRMHMTSINMRCICHLVAVEHRRACYQILGNLVRLLRGDFLVRRKTLDEVFVLAATGFAPGTFGFPHFIKRVSRITVNAANQALFGLAVPHNVPKSMPQGSP